MRLTLALITLGFVGSAAGLANAEFAPMYRAGIPGQALVTGALLVAATAANAVGAWRYYRGVRPAEAWTEPASAG